MSTIYSIKKKNTETSLRPCLEWPVKLSPEDLASLSALYSAKAQLKQRLGELHSHAADTPVIEWVESFLALSPTQTYGLFCVASTLQSLNATSSVFNWPEPANLPPATGSGVTYEKDGDFHTPVPSEPGTDRPLVTDAKDLPITPKEIRLLPRFNTYSQRDAITRVDPFLDAYELDPDSTSWPTLCAAALEGLERRAQFGSALRSNPGRPQGHGGKGGQNGDRGRNNNRDRGRYGKGNQNTSTMALEPAQEESEDASATLSSEEE